MMMLMGGDEGREGKKTELRGDPRSTHSAAVSACELMERKWELGRRAQLSAHRPPSFLGNVNEGLEASAI